GGGRVFQGLIKKPAGIVHATGLEADDQTEPPPQTLGGSQSGHGLKCGGGRVVRDRTRSPQAWMREEFGTRGWIRHQTDRENSPPAGPLQGLQRQPVSLVQ